MLSMHETWDHPLHTKGGPTLNQRSVPQEAAMVRTSEQIDAAIHPAYFI